MRLLPPAVDDLLSFHKKDRATFEKIVRRLLYIQRDSQVGFLLSGHFADFRKLKVTHPELRIVWKVLHDENGEEVIEIAQIWAIGARANGEIYKELKKRIALLEGNQEATELSRVLAIIATGKREAIPKLQPLDPVPSYLEEALVNRMGLSAEAVRGLTGPIALELWTQFIQRGN